MNTPTALHPAAVKDPASPSTGPRSLSIFLMKTQRFVQCHHLPYNITRLIDWIIAAKLPSSNLPTQFYGTARIDEQPCQVCLMPTN